jgi:DNA primase
MPRYAEDSKERIRDAVDFVAVVNAKTELRRVSAKEYTGLCPFHDERTPSFGIDPLKKIYHCFGCGVGGDVFTFVQETEGVDFPTAMEILADRAGVELEVVEEDPRAAQRRARRERLSELLGRASAYYVRTFWESDEAADAREYMTGRGFTEETLRAFRVGYAPSAWDTLLLAARRQGYTDEELLASGVATRSRDKPGRIYDRFRSRIMFPIADVRGRVVGFGGRTLQADHPAKYLNSPEGEMFHKSDYLYALDVARSQVKSEAIVAEGYMDVLALHQAGLRNSVGVMGTSLTEKQVEELSRVTPRVALALDADAAGKDAMLRAARVAEGRDLELRVVPMEAGTDPADLVARDGAEAMAALVGRSVPFVRFHVDRILEKADTGSAEGRDRALGELREVLGTMEPSSMREELVRVVAGRLGLSDQLAATLTQRQTRMGETSAGRARGGGASQPDTRSAPSAGSALDRRDRTERTFLALCIAMPVPGSAALRRVDLEKHFTSVLSRRVASHLREHLASPLEGIAEEDTEMRALLEELDARAARGSATPDTLEVETLQLEKERLERDIAAARASGGLDIATLAAERTVVMDRLDGAMDRASAEAGGG